MLCCWYWTYYVVDRTIRQHNLCSPIWISCMLVWLGVLRVITVIVIVITWLHRWRIVWKCGCRSTHFAVVHPHKLMKHPWRTSDTVLVVRHGCSINFCGCTTGKWMLRHPHFHTILHLCLVGNNCGSVHVRSRIHDVINLTYAVIGVTRHHLSSSSSSSTCLLYTKVTSTWTHN